MSSSPCRVSHCRVSQYRVFPCGFLHGAFLCLAFLHVELFHVAVVHAELHFVECLDVAFSISICFMPSSIMSSCSLSTISLWSFPTSVLQVKPCSLGIALRFEASLGLVKCHSSPWCGVNKWVSILFRTCCFAFAHRSLSTDKREDGVVY